MATFAPANLARLSKSRRKRPVPEGWATAEAISAYQPTETSQSLYPGSKILAVNSSGELALIGGVDGVVGVYSLSEKSVTHTIQADGPVTDAIWASEKPVLASSTGSVKVFENGNEVASFKLHSGAATALAVHATGDIVASVGTDKSYVLYDLAAKSVITQIFADACKSPSMARSLTSADIYLSSATIRQVSPRRPPHRCWWSRPADQDLRRQNRFKCCKLHDVGPCQMPLLL